MSQERPLPGPVSSARRCTWSAPFLGLFPQLEGACDACSCLSLLEGIEYGNSAFKNI